MRVVCVDDSEQWDGYQKKRILEKGKIYTVRREDKYDYSSPWGVHFSFWLDEIRREDDVPFGAWRFRPLDESRLDQFRVHLNTVPKREEEVA